MCVIYVLFRVLCKIYVLPICLFLLVETNRGELSKLPVVYCSTSKIDYFSFIIAFFIQLYLL